MDQRYAMWRSKPPSQETPKKIETDAEKLQRLQIEQLQVSGLFRAGISALALPFLIAAAIFFGFILWALIP